MRRTAPLLLVVDDDGSPDEIIPWLMSRGFNAVSATSFVEARAVLEAIPIEGLIGHLALRDGSFFELAHILRRARPAVVIGYADVDVQPPPELDACFMRPLNRPVLGQFLAVRFGRYPSGEHLRVASDRLHSVPPAMPEGAEARPGAAFRRR